MTFTEFIRDTTRPGPRPSFIQLARYDDLWPAESNRLDDFEAFLLSRLEEESEEVIPELRDLWRKFADAVGRTQGKHDLDLAVAAWGDYARHRRDCAGTVDEPCTTEQELLEAALEASGFEDHPARTALPCTDLDEREEEVDELFEYGDEGEWDEHEEQEERC